MIIKVYQTGFNEHHVSTESITLTETPTDYTITLPSILRMSDRCLQFPVDDPRAWAYELGFQCNLIIRASVDLKTNALTAKVISFSDWEVERVQGPTPSGRPVVQGNYSWYSSINGSEIARYIGPTVSGEGDHLYTGEGGTMTIDFGTVQAEQEGAHHEYANLLNHVNGLRSQAWVTVANDLPADYRPGLLLGSDSSRLSHNRASGAANILKPSGEWATMRTRNGAAQAGDPPMIRHASSFLNMRKFD